MTGRRWPGSTARSWNSTVRQDAMRLLVTGGSGFLGGYVLAEAARRGHSCIALARSARGGADGGRARRHAAGRRS